MARPMQLLLLMPRQLTHSRTVGTPVTVHDISVTQVRDGVAPLTRSEPLDGRIQTQLGPEASTADLVRDAIAEARELVQLEVALAKNEVRGEIAQAKASSVGFGVALFLVIEGVAMLLVALVLAIAPTAPVALVVGLVLLAVAAVSGFAGYKLLPKKPMDHTRRRLQADLEQLKERLA
jgi:uncharacterized membrane protein YqjE